ncbi:hypothetical protein BC827DRAFT_210089 [Russula dissimulans]|nr:hypothetical protein BC827DRAFT_210089 [Russula dissimulans]
MSGPPPTSIPPNVNVEELAAPLILGGIWNWCLFGVLVVQTYVYSYNFPVDRRPIKLLVYGVLLLETLQTALSGADLYYWFASGFGNFEHLTSPYATVFDVPMIGSLVSLTVQFFFMYRILVLSKRESWWLCVFIFLCSIISAIGAFSGGIYTHVRGKFATGRILKMLALTWLTGNTISDLLITAAMVFYLVRRRVRQDYASSHAMVSIVRLTVETNIITTTVSVASLLMISLFPDKNWYVCPTSILGKIYSNTLLVSLNNRIAIRERSAPYSGERARGGPAASFPTNTFRSEATTEISLTDMHKAPDTLKIPPIEGLDLHERILNSGA